MPPALGVTKLLSGGNPQIDRADGDEPVQAYIAAMPAWKRDVGRRPRCAHPARLRCPERATRMMICCRARMPSVRAAGPGCRMIVDFTS
jgi:hypothetical protein